MNHESPIRAPRKPLRVPVSYRIGAESHWRYGTTENLSRTGVLLRLDAPVRVAAPIQIVLAIPPRVLDTAPCDLACTGLVRRIASSSGAEHVVGVEFAHVAVDALDAVIARV
jgi:hypothetical protein